MFRKLRLWFHRNFGKCKTFGEKFRMFEFIPLDLAYYHNCTVCGKRHNVMSVTDAELQHYHTKHRNKIERMVHGEMGNLSGTVTGRFKKPSHTRAQRRADAKKHADTGVDPLLTALVVSELLDDDDEDECIADKILATDKDVVASQIEASKNYGRSNEVDSDDYSSRSSHGSSNNYGGSDSYDSSSSYDSGSSSSDSGSSSFD